MSWVLSLRSTTGEGGTKRPKGANVTAMDTTKLAAEGWIRRNVACEPRLSEAVETYRGLGHEVLLVPVLAEFAAAGATGSCTECFGTDEDPGRYQVIYTRPKAGSEEDQDELL